MKKKMLLILLAVALGVATIAAATMAWFTDEDTAGDATFTAGILDIDVSDGLNELLDVATIDHMNPGDEFGPISIDIVNQGTKKLAWFGDWEFTYVDQLGHEDGDKLLDALYIKEMKMEMLDPEGNLWTDDPWYQGDRFIVDGRGALYDYNQGQADHYNGLANLSGFNVITLTQSLHQFYPVIRVSVSFNGTISAFVGVVTAKNYVRYVRRKSYIRYHPKAAYRFNFWY